MCPVCRSFICLPECPRYEGISLSRGRPIAECEDCGSFIYRDDVYFEWGRFCWCAECAKDEIEAMRSDKDGKEKNAEEEDRD